MLDSHCLELKVVLIGDKSVGKTSIIHRFCHNQFSPQQAVTIGAAFTSKMISVNGQYIKFQIWDTAGQEKYRALLPLYYRDADVALVVFDVSNEHSFSTLKEWMVQLEHSAPEKLSMSVNTRIGMK